ncbi:MAG: lipopolysaccharide transport periplasmic protein LptA [Nitrospinota bacterium]|nr:lipopolysaccharide transport periplasmic protein LptA [Nitrospinota bacterium]
MRLVRTIKILVGFAAILPWLAAQAPPPAFAQSVTEGFLKKKGGKDDVPIHVVSDRMVADNKNQWVHFIGNVTATRGDLVIHSDRLEVYRNPKSEKIDRIEAIGRVDISRGTKYATADKAVFYDAEQKIVLLGNPKAWENDNIIVGHKMNFYLKTDQLIVEGDSNRRVDVVLYPAKEKESNQSNRSSDNEKAPSPQALGNGKGSAGPKRTAGDP